MRVFKQDMRTQITNKILQARSFGSATKVYAGYLPEIVFLYRHL